MNDGRCATCAAWEPVDDTRRVGECRRRAPRPTDPRDTTKRVWPTTGWGDWCFEHQRGFEVEA